MFKKLTGALSLLLVGANSDLTAQSSLDFPSSQVFVIEKDSSEELWIDARGQEGAAARGALFFGSTPESGSSGASGGHVTIVVRHLPSKVWVDARGGRGGDGAPGARGRHGLPGAEGKPGGFFSRASEGEDGAVGQNGGDGSHGGHGGKGGRVRILYIPQDEYNPNWKDHFEVLVDGGTGGRGGLGGLGGRGGAGGLGGKKFWSQSRVDSGQDGRSGQSGRAGMDGGAGEPGEVEFIELEDLRDFLLEEFSRSS